MILFGDFRFCLSVPARQTGPEVSSRSKGMIALHWIWREAITREDSSVLEPMRLPTGPPTFRSDA